MNAVSKDARGAGAEGGTVSEPAPESVSGPTPEPAPEDDLVLATARRIIATDAAIIHRLGTI